MTDEEVTPVEEPVVELPQPEVDPTNGKTVSSVAQEVIAGHWSRGHERDRRLAEAGFDVGEVNREVFRILGLNKS